jgi:hypothetical protein
VYLVESSVSRLFREHECEYLCIPRGCLCLLFSPAISSWTFWAFPCGCCLKIFRQHPIPSLKGNVKYFSFLVVITIKLHIRRSVSAYYSQILIRSSTRAIFIRFFFNFRTEKLNVSEIFLFYYQVRKIRNNNLVLVYQLIPLVLVPFSRNRHS